MGGSKSRDSKPVKVARITILVPRDAEVERLEDLDELLGDRGERRSDALLLLRYRGVEVAVIIEDTGVPEPKDFERLRETEARLREMGLAPRTGIVVRLVHHRGVRRGKTLLRSMARSYRVELVECSSVLDLSPLLRRLAR